MCSNLYFSNIKLALKTVKIGFYHKIAKCRELSSVGLVTCYKGP